MGVDAEGHRLPAEPYLLSPLKDTGGLDSARFNQSGIGDLKTHSFIGEHSNCQVYRHVCVSHNERLWFIKEAVVWHERIHRHTDRQHTRWIHSSLNTVVYNTRGWSEHRHVERALFCMRAKTWIWHQLRFIQAGCIRLQKNDEQQWDAKPHRGIWIQAETLSSLSGPSIPGRPTRSSINMDMRGDLSTKVAE